MQNTHCYSLQWITHNNMPPEVLTWGCRNSLKHEYNQMTATVHLSSQHALQQNGQSPRLVVPAKCSGPEHWCHLLNQGMRLKHSCSTQIASGRSSSMVSRGQMSVQLVFWFSRSSHSGIQHVYFEYWEQTIKVLWEDWRASLRKMFLQTYRFIIWWSNDYSSCEKSHYHFWTQVQFESSSFLNWQSYHMLFYHSDKNYEVFLF